MSSRDPTSGEPTKAKRALRRIVVLGVLIVLLVMAGGAALLAFAGAAVDHLQAREERSLATQIVSRFRERVVLEITTASVWDQAYEQLKPGVTDEWADAEIGSYYANNLGHHAILVLDPSDRPFYAWLGDERADPSALTQFQRDAQPLIDKVRAAERASLAPTRVLAPSDPARARTASGIIRSDGVYYFVGVSNVVRDTIDGAMAPGPKVLVVSGHRLTDRMEQFSQELQTRNASIRAEPRAGHNFIPLVDPAGARLGVIDWPVRKPGMAVLRAAGPIVLLGLIILLAVAAVLARHVRQIASELEAEELAHADLLRQLTAARDRAEDASRAKSQFLANMSHEIRTPLNGILGMVQVMERSDLGQPNAERLEIIRDAGETLLSVLNGILDLSKIEAGRFELDIQEFDLVETVNAACKPFAGLAAQKDIEFEIDIDHSAHGVWHGDPMRLRQVLSNLVANAVKFTSHGEVRIEVVGTSRGLRFSVTDTGIGIPADRVSELFEKFVQADSSMSRRFGGTGLGLAICREFVDIMGGRLAVQTQEGEGSTFAFELPLPKVREAPAADAGQAPVGAPPLSLRILAAEDSKPNQLVLKALLEPLGVNLRVVSDGIEAVRAFKEADFDLVLMDIQMPHMNGVDAVAAIRKFEAQKKRPTTPILALSANVMSHQLKEYFAAGMDGYVAKPIDAASLIRTIRQTLEPAPQAARA
ncbi:MAG TPA: ATP-binding protein [Caulobacteraceae bacterium]|nr:ATP-binding protein [Caulobacteraceae bacterium]